MNDELAAWQATANGYRSALERLQADLDLARRELAHIIADSASIRDQERAFVVAWLRKVSHPCCHQCNDELAADIERGDHLRGEKP